ncbi:MAG: DUF1854 domain-containing protein [Phycisphaerae bacterium]|jgi:hypothetical protein
MTEPETSQDPRPDGVDPTTIRYLSPEMCRIHLGTHGALHVTVLNDRIYGGVYAAHAFPVAYPDSFISLIHTVGKGKDFEIGIIRDLKAFPESDANLVRHALAQQYFVHTIHRIRHIGWKYGFVAMDVDTDKGEISFLMRWQHERAVDYGKRGKVIIDADENRYLIPDVSALSPREQSDLKRYIYW